MLIYWLRVCLFQSTLPLRGATGHLQRGQKDTGISIHAPLAGSDIVPNRTLYESFNFNPRSPCGERQRAVHFMSRPKDFNPRSPCGERLNTLNELAKALDFNPRSPCGERRECCRVCAMSYYFNPRSPCGERRLSVTGHFYPIGFQSTLPLRGATHPSHHIFCRRIISIHAPLAGSDEDIPYFLNAYRISIHAPLAGSDFLPLSALRALDISIHAPLAGSDSWQYWHPGLTSSFQSTLPLRGATNISRVTCQVIY